MSIALVYAAVLTVVVMAMAYFIASETRSVGFQLDDTKALYLAQAGVERAFREIRDEVLTPPPGGTATADLRGATASTTGSGVSNVARIRYIDETTGTATISGSGTANLRAFDSNYTQARIISVFLCGRARRAASGNGATLQVSYSTNGVFPQPGNTVLTQALTTALATYTADITADRVWSWPVIMGSTFTLRAQRTSGTSSMSLDAIFLRVTYAIDTNKGKWYDGTYDTFPKSLGDGYIQSVSIADEARKVNLNTASQALLRYLMQERGVPSGTANTLATRIVNYRGTSPSTGNPFDSVEELQQVTGMTAAYYNLIKDYVTVHSFINTYEQRPIANWDRAPLNINTAAPEVLRAVFDPILTASLSTQLANDIVTARTVAPFTCFYNSNAAVTTDFYDFIMGRSYLSTARRNQILDNADASLLVPVPGYGGMNEQTTEFCYAGTTYRIESVGKITVPGPVTNDIDLRIATVVGNDGSRIFPVYSGQPAENWKGYWKENYE